MLPQISRILSRIPIDSIAFESGFIRRRDYIIDPLNFLLSFFHMMSKNVYSQQNWARILSLMLGQTISSQALQKKLTFRHVRFAKMFLEHVLSYSLSKTSLGGQNLLKKFNCVFVTDSTCLSMPKILRKIFPGSHSINGDAATAKIQLTMEIKSDAICKMDLASFRNNDQSYAFDILKVAQKDDLVIRDLGYLVMDCLAAMIKAQIYFISRLQKNIYVYDNQGVKINLLEKLKVSFRQGMNCVDLQVKLSKKLIPVRLIAIETPKEIVDKRTNKAKKDRHYKANHSPLYYEMLNYTILITNISSEDLDAIQAFQIYALRWRIECIFKCWKSHMNLQKLFKENTYNNPAKPYILLLLMLAMISLTHNLIFIPLIMKFKNKNSIPNLSLNKFTQILMQNGSLLELKKIKLKFLYEYIQYFGTYQSKKGKNTYLEKLYKLN